MFVRVSRYRIMPDQSSRYLAIQERAKEIYRQHEENRTSYFRSTVDPCIWLEVHWYPDEAACRRVSTAIHAEPQIAELWTEFQATLDPNFPMVVEEYHSPAAGS